MVIAKITQKPDKPVESPNIFGPKILPSNCCIIKIRITKYNACFGSTINTRKVLGIAPIYGPKNGITLVTPTITLTKSAYGVPIILVHMKQIIPIIMESMKKE